MTDKTLPEFFWTSTGDGAGEEDSEELSTKFGFEFKETIIAIKTETKTSNKRGFFKLIESCDSPLAQEVNVKMS